MDARKILFTVNVIWILALQAFAQGDSKTHGLMNGRGWVILTNREKLYCTQGMLDAWTILAAEAPAEPAAIKSFLLAFLANIDAPAATLGELVQQIDLFYKDSANMPIPVVEGLKYSAKRIKGASARELDDYVATLRATFSQ